jgi:rod shape-determining protein MreC
VPLVRAWAITAVAPAASAIEGVRNGTTGFFSNYFALRDAREQSRKFHSEVDRLRLENQFLKNELASAQRAEGLAGFQARTPSKMIGARVIGTTAGVGGKSVLIDRGNASGVHKGMAVVTPDGIVGRVLAVYPFASQVLSVTDPGFAAGVESQKNRVHGVLKGLGNGTTKIDYVPIGQKVENGEMFYTSGEDRVFPKGLPVGRVTSVKDGSNFQEISVDPTGVENAPEEVLVIVNPVHQEIPEAPPSDTPVFLSPDVKRESQQEGASGEEEAHVPSGTQADKLMEQYRKIGEAQKHKFGEGLPGTPPPNFNLKVPGVNAPAAPPGAAVPASPVRGSQAAAVTAPGVTSPPGTTSQPGPASRPGVTPQPGAASRPGAASQPGTTSQPGVTPQTGVAPQPGAASKPGVTSPPGATSPSGTISRPHVTPQPGTATQPGGTSRPGSTTQPGSTTPPRTTTQPGPANQPVPRSAPAQPEPRAPAQP